VHVPGPGRVLLAIRSSVDTASTDRPPADHHPDQDNQSTDHHQHAIEPTTTLFFVPLDTYVTHGGTKNARAGGLAPPGAEAQGARASPDRPTALTRRTSTHAA
jgi:hypothetical protein